MKYWEVLENLQNATYPSITLMNQIRTIWQNVTVKLCGLWSRVIFKQVLSQSTAAISCKGSYVLYEELPLVLHGVSSYVKR